MHGIWCLLSLSLTIRSTIVNYRPVRQPRRIYQERSTLPLHRLHLDSDMCIISPVFGLWLSLLLLLDTDSQTC